MVIASASSAAGSLPGSASPASTRLMYVSSGTETTSYDPSFRTPMRIVLVEPGSCAFATSRPIRRPRPTRAQAVRPTPGARRLKPDMVFRRVSRMSIHQPEKRFDVRPHPRQAGDQLMVVIQDRERDV